MVNSYLIPGCVLGDLGGVGEVQGVGRWGYINSRNLGHESLGLRWARNLGRRNFLIGLKELGFDEPIWTNELLDPKIIIIYRI